MGDLHQLFKKAIRNMNFTKTQFPLAVFYNTPIGLRFEIGIENDSIYMPNGEINPIYLQKAFCRAKTLFEKLPYYPNILRIDHFPEESESVSSKMLMQIGLPTAHESVIETYKTDEDDCCIQEHLYWDLTKCDCCIEQLLLEIIKSDMGGFSVLCSSVYLLNAEHNLLYHLYDDRGADIVAKDKNTLVPLYKEFNAWILEYDKERIEQLFCE